MYYKNIIDMYKHIQAYVAYINHILYVAINTIAVIVLFSLN